MDLSRRQIARLEVQPVRERLTEIERGQLLQRMASACATAVDTIVEGHAQAYYVADAVFSLEDHK